MSDLRALPSVEQILQSEAAGRWITDYGRPLVLDAVRTTLKEIREDYQPGRNLPAGDELFAGIEQLLVKWTLPTLQAVINATGVILHTNLGRAPLSRAAVQAMEQVAAGYSTLEYDLETGQRGSRLVHAEGLLQQLSGAEAVLVVNNNAAAVLLVLTGLAHRRAVVIARSQLVEIGGGFRVPEVMKQSGARLLEVGTTNRVHLSDYHAALEGKPALVLRAHRSNFVILGFTEEPALSELAGLAHEAGISLVDDLGSGSLLETERYGLGHEPMVQESLAAGADLVCFSGDKLLGGPQAGIIIGRAELVAKLKKHPLARAVRADKLCLAALTATLLHYLKDEAEDEIPVWRMIAAPGEQIRARAQVWQERLGCGELVAGQSTVGGGSLPGETMPTTLLALPVRSPNRFQRRLRGLQPPIIARLEAERVVLDPRTVLPEEEDSLLDGLQAALAGW
jgi:L-seryl-tRNA(Ser) seleniumtransferase